MVVREVHVVDDHVSGAGAGHAGLGSTRAIPTLRASTSLDAVTAASVNRQARDRDVDPAPEVEPMPPFRLDVTFRAVEELALGVALRAGVAGESAGRLRFAGVALVVLLPHPPHRPRPLDGDVTHLRPRRYVVS